MKKIWHWLLHVTKRNSGRVITWADDGYIFVGFECTCGYIDPKTVDKIEESKIYG